MSETIFSYFLVSFNSLYYINLKSVLFLWFQCLSPIEEVFSPGSRTASRAEVSIASTSSGRYIYVHCEIVIVAGVAGTCNICFMLTQRVYYPCSIGWDLSRISLQQYCWQLFSQPLYDCIILLIISIWNCSLCGVYSIEMLLGTAIL